MENVLYVSVSRMHVPVRLLHAPKGILHNNAVWRIINANYCNGQLRANACIHLTKNARGLIINVVTYSFAVKMHAFIKK